VLREVGGEGQRRLIEARIAVIGAGGIGAPVIQYLAAAGVGELRIIDDDSVDLSNLQRQILFDEGQIGTSKVVAAAETVARLNPEVRVIRLAERLDSTNAADLLAGADVVVDGSDNFATRLAAADSALALHIPFVSAAVAEFEGQLAVYRGWEEGKPCYRCFVGSEPDRPERSCAEQGVLGAMAGVLGSLAALEAIRIVTGFGEDSAGKLLLADALTMRFRTVALPKDPGCPACRA
ncbi:MAG: HesA/MoeB/ThiF family protein, partial [Allosphingosinicella sp.]